jgi:hypothetical protein
MTVAEWLKMAKADAEHRGGPELVAALEGLAKATEALRGADWNDDTTVRRGASSEAPAPMGESKSPSEGRSKDLPLR